MNFKHLLWGFRLLNLQILSELRVEFGQELVGDYLGFLLVEVGDKDLLSCCVEGKLLFDKLIGTILEKFSNLIVVIELDGDPEGNGVL